MTCLFFRPPLDELQEGAGELQKHFCGNHMAISLFELKIMSIPIKDDMEMLERLGLSNKLLAISKNF